MNNGMKKALALALVASMALTACSSGTTTEKPAEGTTTTPAEGTTAPAESAGEDKYQIKDLVVAKNASAALQTFNVLHSQTAEDGESLIQWVDGLCETDNMGRLTPGIAKEWGTNDGGLTWTFNLREGVKWVDWQGNEMADCGSEDFATGLEWVLNYHKNQAANASMPMELIKGATEYYEYTKNLSEEEAFALTSGEGSKFMEMVGIETPDATTVIYHCTTNKPYFDTLAPYCALFPLDQGAVDAIGGPKAYAAADNTGIWYNGPYTCTEYIHANSTLFEKNPMYWDTESYRFDSVRFMYVDSADTMYTLYQNGEIDYVGLTEANLNTIYNDPNHEFNDNLVPTIRRKYSYQFHFNYDKHNEDGTLDMNWNKAIANLNFRKALWTGMNFEDYNKRTNAIDPLSLENNYYTMEGLVYTSEGKDYTALVNDYLGLPAKTGERYVRLDDAKRDEYKAAAMEELAAEGVTFPVKMTYYIQGSNQTSLDSANVLADTFKNSNLSDMVELEIKTYVSSSTQEVRNPRLHSVMLNGWGADYGDPMNYLAQEIKDYDNAWYATAYSNINDVEVAAWSEDLHAAYDEFTKLVWEADAIVDDLDARYDAFAKAEAYMLENVLVMPYQYSQSYCLTKYNIHSQMNAMFGSCNYKMKNWETKADGYTTAEMAEIAANKGK